MNDYMKANLDWWNDAAITHAQGDAYELAAFKSGKSKLKTFCFCRNSIGRAIEYSFGSASLSSSVVIG